MYKFIINNLPRPLLIRLSYVFKYLAPLIYKGNNVECNVCDKSFSKFLDYGHGDHFRKGALCPYCLSLERHRLIWYYLEQKTDFFSNKPYKMLHIAPEQCFYKVFRNQKNLDYTTGDLFSPLADIKFDLHSIPLPDNTYDIVFCNHVLEHVENAHQCMTELYRVLKPGGFAILQVPIDSSREKTYEDPSITSPEDREREFWQKDHVRLFGRDYGLRLQAAGFMVDENQLVNEVGDAIVKKHGFPKGEILYVGKK